MFLVFPTDLGHLIIGKAIDGGSERGINFFIINDDELVGLD